MDMEGKRAREEEEWEQEEDFCLKKLCRGLGIEEEEEEEGERRSLGESQESEELLSGVIRSLEEEINLSPGSSTSAAAAEAEASGGEEIERENLAARYRRSSSAELSYLLEASDDELGIGCASPALSEADLSIPPCPEQMRASLILEFLEGEVITDFPGLEDEWIRRAVATMEMIDPSAVASGASMIPGFESPAQPLLVESSSLL